MRAQRGGGILTPYGRALSKESLSTWGADGESDFLYGLVKPPSWLNLGGDFRAAETYTETATPNNFRFILMQADLEAAIHFSSQWKFVGTLGRLERDASSIWQILFYSRRHFLMYQPSELFRLRFGRFFPAFGIQDADHTILTKDQLGWREGAEVYNFEASWIAPSFDFYATLLFGRIDHPEFDRDRGIALRSSFFVGENLKLGGTYLFGVLQQYVRHVLGPFLMFGFTPRFTFLSELDFSYVCPKSGDPPSFGTVFFIKPDYEIFQGFHLFLSQEFARQQTSDPTTQLDATGIGIQFFPRPHWEFLLTYKYRKEIAASTDHHSFAFLLGHFYP